MTRCGEVGECGRERNFILNEEMGICSEGSGGSRRGKVVVGTGMKNCLELATSLLWAKRLAYRVLSICSTLNNGPPCNLILDNL